MSVSELAVHLDPGDLVRQMAADVAAGLGTPPRTLPPKYFYDARGSELFDQITRLPEYYPTRAERAILQARVEQVAALTQAETLIELGSGTSEKTRLLLDALTRAGTLRRFVPFDVDPAVLTEASAQVARELPGLAVEPVVGDFERHLDVLPGGGRRLLAFLGSTIGNFEPAARAQFLQGVRGTLGEGDHLLLGTDLVKSPERLVAAYDDAAGVTAEFDKNVLRVLNRELGGDFNPDAFAHVAVWDAEREWVEMRLRSLRRQSVRLARPPLEVTLEEGEEIRTEVSAKFRRELLEAELEGAGLRLVEWWTDPAGDFALSLSQPV